MFQMEFNYNSQYPFQWNSTVPFVANGFNQQGNIPVSTAAPNQFIGQVPVTNGPNPPGFNSSGVLPFNRSVFPFGINNGAPIGSSNWNYGYNNFGTRFNNPPTQPPQTAITQPPQTAVNVSTDTQLNQSEKTKNMNNSNNTMSTAERVTEEITDEIALKVSSMLSNPDILKSAISRRIKTSAVSSASGNEEITENKVPDISEDDLGHLSFVKSDFSFDGTFGTIADTIPIGIENSAHETIR